MRLRYMFIQTVQAHREVAITLHVTKALTISEKPKYVSTSYFIIIAYTETLLLLLLL